MNKLRVSSYWLLAVHAPIRLEKTLTEDRDRPLRRGIAGSMVALKKRLHCNW